MGLRIMTNVQALQGQRNLNSSRTAQEKSLERLSSGFRINRAGDDAAGLAISERIKSNTRSLAQASRNAADGISLVQVAEGATTEISNILIRMRELSVQGASDTIAAKERSFIDKEIQALKSEVDRISHGTEYNGTKLLNGEAEKLEIQVGLFNDPSRDRMIFEANKHNVSADALGIKDVGTMTKADAQNNLEKLDAALSNINEQRSSLGAVQNRLQSTINNLAIYRENLEAAGSRIKDTDMAVETSELTKQNILTTAGISVLGQANSNPQQALKLLG